MYVYVFLFFLSSFKCRQMYHAPTDCATIRKWLTKCADDSETANYISAHTKDVSKFAKINTSAHACTHRDIHSLALFQGGGENNFILNVQKPVVLNCFADPILSTLIGWQCPKCNICIEKNGGCNHMVSSVHYIRLHSLLTPAPSRPSRNRGLPTSN